MFVDSATAAQAAEGDPEFSARVTALLERIEGEGLVTFRYLGGNPNGSLNDIAGLTDAAGNVVGLMPHPEHAIERGFGPDDGAGPRTGTDGLELFRTVLGRLLG